MNLADEARFVAALIGANFSNYSAWHHRSALLFLSTTSDRSTPASLALTWSLPEREVPAAAATLELSSTELFAPRCPSHSIFLQLLRAEFELLQNAFFTDPNDQTAWIYYFWLLAFGTNYKHILLCMVQYSYFSIRLWYEYSIVLTCIRSYSINRLILCTEYSQSSSLFDECSGLVRTARAARFGPRRADLRLARTACARATFQMYIIPDIAHSDNFFVRALSLCGETN